MYKPVDPYSRMQSAYNYNMRGGAYPPRYVHVLNTGGSIPDPLHTLLTCVGHGARDDLVVFGLPLHCVGDFRMYLDAVFSSCHWKGPQHVPHQQCGLRSQAIWLKKDRPWNCFV